MEYRAIGIMSGSSLDGLDIAFVIFNETGRKWAFQIEAAECLPYPAEWAERLKNSVNLNARDYMQLHADYGHYIGRQINAFIEKNNLQHRVQIIGSHGHTTFHYPQSGMTAQLGNGAAIASNTGINTVSDLRDLDIALGGQGAPIVPMGEKLLFEEYPLLLNLGGIANISAALPQGYLAYDICPANRVLNMLAAEKGLEYDADGAIAAAGMVRDEALAALNQLPYYTQPFPKSLDNGFGVDVVYPLLKKFNLGNNDAMRTMVEHINVQVMRNAGRLASKMAPGNTKKMLVTGGGTLNTFLAEKLTKTLTPLGIEIIIPDAKTINYKEALIMALLGVLRWREENTTINTVTGATRSSIGGAVWMGQEA